MPSIENRFKEGQKLVYQSIGEIHSKPKTRQEAYWMGFDRAVERLRYLADQMDNSCPYKDDEPISWCFACPLNNDEWEKSKCKANKYGV